MSGSYRLQPPSPFPYSGGSRLEQQLVPALQGPNANSMIGYALGAQLQRQADQMGYEAEMADYNLTAQREGERARQELLADRAEQRQAALTNTLVNRMGPAFLPEGYSLTPQQQGLVTQDMEARNALRLAQTQAAQRRGTGGGTAAATDREDPQVQQQTNAARIMMERALINARRDPNNLEPQRMIGRMPDPNHRPGLRPEIVARIQQEAEAAARQAYPRARQWSTAPQGSGEAVPQPPVQEAPSVAPPSGEVVPPPAAPAAGQAPRSTSEALQRQLITPEQLARARATGQIVRIEPDGTIVTRNAAGEQRVPRQ